MEGIAKFLYEMGQLKQVRRSGWWVAGIKDPESVAEHPFRVAILAYILAHLEGANPTKAAMMCIIHDVHEARLNDVHRIGRNYLDRTKAKERAFLDQVARLPKDIRDELTSMMLDLTNNLSIEARIAHDADLLESLIQAREYQAQGYKDVQEWIDNCRNALITESAKRIAEKCLSVEPSQWWQDSEVANPTNDM